MLVGRNPEARCTLNDPFEPTGWAQHEGRDGRVS
jgi:hypothetical protein